MSWSLVRYVLLASLRDRLLVSMALLLGVGTVLGLFLGSAAIIEKTQFVTVFTAAGLRFVGVIGLVLFVVYHIRRSFETRDIEFLLTKPVSRLCFILSHVAAITILAVSMACLITSVVMAISSEPMSYSYYLWFVSLAMEMIIMVNAALFFAMVLNNASLGVLATLAFYILSRMSGSLLGVIDSGVGSNVLSELMAGIFQLVSLLIPRLDLMAQSSWLLYGADNIAMLFVVAQGVIYTTLLVTATFIDLKNRQF